MFKIGDEVTVYNISESREGEVVAILDSLEAPLRVVVKHRAFGGGAIPVCQRFTFEGNNDSGVVHIKHKDRNATVICNVYAEKSGIRGYAWHTSEPAAKIGRDNGCIGYFKAERNLDTGKLSDFLFIPLEQ